MLNRDINALVRKLKSLAGGNFDNPAKFAAIMETVHVVGLAIQEKNPNFNIRDFEKRIAGF